MTKQPGSRRRRRWIRAGLLVAGAVAALVLARELTFVGPLLPVRPLPGTEVVDLHCHTAGIGAGGSGCYVSAELQGSYKFDVYLRAFGTSREELERGGDRVVVDRIAEWVRASAQVGSAVVLALDGVVDARGRLDLESTEVYVPNEFLAAAVARHPQLHLGASINPYRHDALPRLRRARASGAVLIKWIPSIQGIDPADPRLESFYLQMRELDLPLLVHTGQERSFTRARDELADPARLELPLSLGLTVIAAHAATNGTSEGEDNFSRFLDLVPRHPRLYADVSSLTQINKLGHLARVLAEPELRERLVYGSDFPLIHTLLVKAWYFPRNLTLARMREVEARDNPFDRDVALKQALGLPPEVFARSGQLLGIAR